MIKHHATRAFRYVKQIEQQAQQQATERYQQAQQQVEHIHKIAYQQGYSDGLKQLLSKLIESIEISEKCYQQAVNQSQETLLQQLSALFHDPHLQEIIAKYLIQQQERRPITLYLPDRLQNMFNHIEAGLKILPSVEGDIALEIGNEVIHFSPTIAAEQTLPQILSVSARCQILAERKSAYQHIMALIEQGDCNDIPTNA